MPAFQTVLSRFNEAFAPHRIDELAATRDRFGMGAGLDYAVDLATENTSPMNRMLKSYLGKLPPAIREAIRAVIMQALEMSPPTQITFAWAPGYDYEMQVWQAPDTKDTRGGITVLLRSRYPDDRHPLA
jgi:hypothetical protein